MSNDRIDLIFILFYTQFFVDTFFVLNANKMNILWDTKKIVILSIFDAIFGIDKLIPNRNFLELLLFSIIFRNFVDKYLDF